MMLAMFTFFCRLSDPQFGGTYMTLLNTFFYVGWFLPTSFALKLVDVLTFSRCSNDVQNFCFTQDSISVKDFFFNKHPYRGEGGVNSTAIGACTRNVSFDNIEKLKRTRHSESNITTFIFSQKYLKIDFLSQIRVKIELLSICKS